MTSKIQLITFLVSFLYGILFSFLTIFNFKIISNLRRIIKHLITFIYVLDVMVIYIIILYKINHGYFHIYFIMITIIGYLCGLYFYHKYISKVDVKALFSKLLKR